MSALFYALLPIAVLPETAAAIGAALIALLALALARAAAREEPLP